jgi:hypothetical protein
VVSLGLPEYDRVASLSQNVSVQELASMTMACQIVAMDNPPHGRIVAKSFEETVKLLPRRALKAVHRRTDKFRPLPALLGHWVCLSIAYCGGCSCR